MDSLQEGFFGGTTASGTNPFVFADFKGKGEERGWECSLEFLLQASDHCFAL